MKANSSTGSEQVSTSDLPAVRVSLPSVRFTHYAAPHVHSHAQAHSYPEEEDWTFSENYIHTFYKANLHQSTLQKTQYEICTVSSEYTKKDIQEIEYFTDVQLKTYIIHHTIL